MEWFRGYYRVKAVDPLSTSCEFHSMEIISANCLYLKKGLEFFNKILELSSKFNYKHFDTAVRII